MIVRGLFYGEENRLGEATDNGKADDSDGKSKNALGKERREAYEYHRIYGSYSSRYASSPRLAATAQTG